MTDETIKINQFADKPNLAVSDMLAVVEDSTNTNYKTTLNKLQTFLNTIGVIGLKGVIDTASAAPTEDGIYLPTEDGTYTNFGGEVISLDDNFVVITVFEGQTEFTQISYPITLPNYVKFSDVKNTFDAADEVNPSTMKATADFLASETDATPTLGSTKPVQSGGAYDADKVIQDQVTQIASEKDVLKLTTYYPDGNRINVSGDIIPDPLYFMTNPIEVTVGKRFASVSDDITIGIRYSFYTSNVINSSNFVSTTSARDATVPATATHMVLQGLLTLQDNFIVMQLDSGFPTLGQSTFIYEDLYIKSEVNALVTTNAITAKVNLATGDNRVDVTAIKGIDGLASNDGRYNIYTNNKFKKPLTLVQGDNIESNITPSDPTTIMSAYSYVDASTCFPYVGNAFKGTGLVGFGYMGITIPQADLIKDSGYLNSDDLHVNIEFYAAKNSTVTIAIFQNNGTTSQLGSNISEVVTTGYNVLQFDISGYTYDPDLLHFELRFFDFGYNIFREQDFYFGRINVFSGAASNLLGFDYDSDYNTTLRNTIKKTSSRYNDFKGAFLGDSLTFQRRWIKQVCEHFGITFDSDEIVYGTGGFDPTGVGGSTIAPFIQGGTGTGAGQSIYMRADDVSNYNPKIIFLFGGQNDNPRLIAPVQSGDTGLIGAIDDAPYTGTETSVLADVPTFYASLKGTIVKLINGNPNVPIVLITPSQNEATSLSVSSFDKQKAKRDAFIAVGALYALPVVNLLDESQINELTYSNYLYDGTHFNYKGGDEVANCVIRKL